jgi:hypothetical protein
MQEQVRTKNYPSNSSTTHPPNQPISNLNSALLFLRVAQDEFPPNSVYSCDIDIIIYLLTQTRDAIQTKHDKGPNLASALLRTSVLEESTSIRWNRLTIANDAADLLQQTEALHSAGIQFIVGNHKSWKQRSWELWLMVPSKYYTQAVACLGALPKKSNGIIVGGWPHTGNVE